MAKEEIIIDVKLDAEGVEQQLDAVVGRIVEVKQAQAELKRERAEGTITDAEYIKQSKILSNELVSLTKQQNSLTNAMQMSDKQTEVYGDSLDEMRRKLGDMQKAYAAMSEEQRNSEGGKAFLDSLNKQLNAVKELEAGMGDSRRNVGNYTNSILDAAGKMGGFGKATMATINPIKNATMGLKAMAATPIIAILNVLITLIVKLAEKFKGNAAAMESLTRVFSLFEGVGTLVNKVIDKIAQGVTWLADKLYELAERFGLISDTMKESVRIGQEEIDIQKEQIRLTRQAAYNDNKVSELRAQAAEKDKRTAKERLALLQEAADIEKKQADDEYQLAKRRYELKKAQNAQSESSIEDLQEEVNLEADMVNKQTSYNNKVRELNSQMSELRKSIAKDTAAEVEGVEEVSAATEEVVEDMKERAEKIYKLRKQYGLVSDDEEMQRELDALKANYEEKLLTEEEYQQAAAKIREKYAPKPTEAAKESEDIDAIAKQLFGANKEVIDYYIDLIHKGVEANEAFAMSSKYMAKTNAKAFADACGSMSDAFSDMSTLLEEYGGQTESAKKAQKAFALASILAAQAQSVSEGALAISTGIASASAQPFPLNIAAIASVVATITGLLVSTASSFVQAKQLLSGADDDGGKYATGGVVPGTSYTGDRVGVRVNSGEMILTREQQGVLFDIANKRVQTGGIDYDALAAAIAAQPAPIMDYKEFTQFGQKVASYKEITRI